MRPALPNAGLAAVRSRAIHLVAKAERAGKSFLWSGFLLPSGFMFDRLIHFSIHNKLLIGLLTLALVAWEWGHEEARQ